MLAVIRRLFCTVNCLFDILEITTHSPNSTLNGIHSGHIVVIFAALHVTVPLEMVDLLMFTVCQDSWQLQFDYAHMQH